MFCCANARVRSLKYSFLCSYYIWFSRFIIMFKHYLCRGVPQTRALFFLDSWSLISWHSRLSQRQMKRFGLSSQESTRDRRWGLRANKMIKLCHMTLTLNEVIWFPLAYWRSSGRWWRGLLFFYPVIWDNQPFNAMASLERPVKFLTGYSLVWIERISVARLSA